MRAYLNNKKYYNSDGNYLNFDQIRRRDEQYRIRTKMLNQESVLPDIIQRYIFSFVISCDICNIVIDPKQYIINEKCCLNVCRNCRNFHAVLQHCTLCKEYMWIDGFPTGMCGCHCGLSVCGNCTNRATFTLYDQFINSDDDSSINHESIDKSKPGR